MKRKHKATMSYMGVSSPLDSLTLLKKEVGEETYHILHSKNFSEGIKKVVIKKKVSGELVIGSMSSEALITSMVGASFAITDLSEAVQLPLR